MAEFNFYAVWEDSVGCLRLLADLHRFTFAVDKWYTEPTALEFTALSSEKESVVRKRSRLYLWSTEYSRFPIGFGEPTSNGLYMIDPAKSGPVLDLKLASGFEVKGSKSVGLGWLGYQLRHQDPNTGEPYKPPESLNRVYNEMRRLLRKHMVKRYFRSRRITERGFRPIIDSCWLGRHAAELLETGQAGILIGAEYDWKRGSDLKKSRTELLPLPDEDYFSHPRRKLAPSVGSLNQARTKRYDCS